MFFYELLQAKLSLQETVEYLEDRLIGLQHLTDLLYRHDVEDFIFVPCILDHRTMLPFLIKSGCL